MLKCNVEVTAWQKGEVEIVDEEEKEALKLLYEGQEREKGRDQIDNYE